MKIIQNQSENPFEILLSLVLIRFVLLALILMFVMPKQEIKDESANSDRGMMKIEITWDTDKNVDIDLWVKGPDNVPIGYSNKNGEIFDLIRDDLGNYNGAHYEISYGRNIKPGVYVVNAMFYANREPGFKIANIEATISIAKKDTGKETKQIAYGRKITLSEVGEEATIVSFEIDDKLELKYSTISTLYKEIYYQLNKRK